MGAGLDLLGCRADGSEFPVDVSLNPLAGVEGGYVIAAVRDITDRRAAEAELRDLRDVLEHVSDALYIFDAETLCFTYVNDGALRQSGFSRDELMTMNPTELFEDLDEDRLLQMLSPLGRSSSPPVVLDSASVGVVLCDDTGELVYANKFADGLLRRHPGSERPRTWLEPTHAEDRHSVGTMVRDAHERGRAGVLRHRLIDRDGAPCWVEHSVVPFIDPDGRVNGFVSTLTDVTIEHTAAARLRESQDVTNAIIDNVGALVAVMTPDLRIMRVNRAVETFTGLAAAGLIGHDLLARVVPDDELDAVREALVDAAVNGTNAFENDWLDAQGRRRHITWTNTPLTDPDGAVRAVVGTGIDVTDQRQLEARVAQADRLSAVGRLAAGLAHDVNNTLTVLGLRMERLRARHGDNAASAGDLDAMGRSLDHTQALIADLVAFGGRQQLRPVPVDLNAATVRMLHDLEELLGEGIGVTFDLTESDTTTLIDPVRFDQVLTNLAINARDAMAGGGTIAISTAVEAVAGRNRPSHLPPQLGPGRYVRLTVSDTGAGIPQHLLSHVFDPYVTTKPASKGTGLGLAVTYGTIAQAGGAIAVESTVGRGTTFTLWLPTVHG